MAACPGAELHRLVDPGEELFEQGKFSAARALFQRAANLVLQTQGSKNRDYVVALSGLGRCTKSMGQHVDAERLFLECIEMQKVVLCSQDTGHEGVLDYAGDLANLAHVFYMMGNYEDAESLYSMSLDRQNEVLVSEGVGSRHMGFALALTGLSNVYKEKACHAEALRVLQTSLAIMQEVCSSGQDDTKQIVRHYAAYAVGLHELARLFQDMDQPSKALPLLQESLEIKERVLGSKHPECALSLQNLALLYQNMGQYARAESLHLQSLQVMKGAHGLNHPATASGLHNLGMLYNMKGQYALAELFCRNSLEIKTKALGAEHPDCAACLTDLGILYHNMDRFADAEQALQDSLKIMEKSMSKHPHYAVALDALGKLYESMGRHTDAESLYLRSLNLTREVLGSKHPSYALCLNNITLLYKQMGQHESALPLACEACSVYSDFTSSCMGILPLQGRLAFTEAAELLVQDCVDIAWQLVLKGSSDVMTVVAEVFCAVARQKNLVFDSHLAGAGLPEASSLLKQQLQTARKQLANYVLERHSTSAVPDRRPINFYLKKVEDLESQLGRDGKLDTSSRWAKLSDGAFLKELRNALPPGSALAEFLVNEDLIFAFVVQHSGAGDTLDIQLLCLGQTVDITQQVKAYRKGLGKSAKSPMSPETLAKGRLLRQRLFDPLRAAIAEDLEHIFLALDGELFSLPFSALPLDMDPANAEPKYLLDQEFTLSYLTAGRDLLWLTVERPTPETRWCRVVADPLFEAEVSAAAAVPEADGVVMRHGGFQQLENAYIEGERVHELLQGCSALDAEVELLTGSEATKEAFLNLSSPPLLLHVATHGFYVPLSASAQRPLRKNEKPDPLKSTFSALHNPLLRCGVALAGAGRWETEGAIVGQCHGIVTGLELLDMKLQGTKVVTLSACETGLGETVLGHGVFGLGKAMQLAGAESVLMSLWTIDDCATCDLMLLFYKHLLEPGSGVFHRAAALRDAQRQLREQSPQYLEPFFWAAFVIHGAVGPMF